MILAGLHRIGPRHPSDFGPTSRFVQGMPGFTLLVGLCPLCGGVHFHLFVCGAGEGHEHFLVEPGFDSSRPPRKGGA